MSDLKKDASALFEAGRRGHEPAAGDHERVLRAVLSQAATVAAVSTATGTAVAKGAFVGGRLLSFGKLVTALALVGAGGAVAYRAAKPAEMQHVANVAAPRPGLRAPAGEARAQGPVSRALPASTVVADQPAAPSRAEAAEASRPHAALARSERPAPEPLPPPASSASFAANGVAPPSSTTVDAVTLGREARALADVQRALREGRSSDALSMLSEQQAQFPDGALAQERQAARVVALCTSGKSAEGRAAAERFLATHASSPVATRIRASCQLP